MEVLWRSISLCGIAALYCLLMAGVRKYHIKDTVKRLAKKEKIMMAVGTGLLCAGILIQIARVPLAENGGVVTDSIYWLTDWLFARNVTAASLAVTVVILVPAVLYQTLFLEHLVVKCRIPYCQMYYFLMIYVFHTGMYRNLNITPGELLILLAVSALLYYGMEIWGGRCDKRSIVYFACLVIFIMVLAVVERPVHWQVYAISGITIAEGMILALFRGVSVILRKTLRKLGTLIVFVGIALFNYWLI